MSLRTVDSPPPIRSSRIAASPSITLREERPLRVLFVLDTMQVGGTELNAVRTAERLDPRRVALEVACFQPSGPLRERYDRIGVPVHEVRIGPLYHPSTIAAGARFARWVRREGFDVVHCHDRYANMFAAPWARFASVPLVIASKRWGMVGRAHNLGSAAAFRFAHAVLANSESVAASVSAVEHVSASRVHTITNFVDDSAFDAPPDGWRRALLGELSVPADAFVIGCVANLRAIKDHATLLRATAAVVAGGVNAHLVLIGEGDRRDALTAQARTLGIGERVHLAGQRPNVPPASALFDVATLCSTSEGFPNAVVEAMAAGVPVVASRVGGIPDAVRDGETGLLFPAGDDAALALALLRIARDEPFRAKLAVQAREQARARYSAAAVLPRLEQLYATARAR